MHPTRMLLSIAAILCLAPALAAAGPLQDDLKLRRARALERLGPDTLAIFWSAPTRVYSTDIDYEYRQDSNLLYLTGVDQEETILILMPGNATRKEILFVREADARREHWDGHSLTPAEATVQSGIQTVMTMSQFEGFIAAMLSKRPMGGSPTEYAAFFQALADGKARLAILMEPQGLRAPPTPTAQFAATLRERFFGFHVTDASPVLDALRQIKTP
ncbi:MAG TPA: aminopeptidase P N-terminal domain-containing protein, partial [Gemmatimonadaceae bacterium]|nr:aminopeptidase P N-terminal domain-containing protein [Gemmatimonadaceae bacterium]